VPAPHSQRQVSSSKLRTIRDQAKTTITLYMKKLDDMAAKGMFDVAAETGHGNTSAGAETDDSWSSWAFNQATGRKSATARPTTALSAAGLNTTQQPVSAGNTSASPQSFTSPTNALPPKSASTLSPASAFGLGASDTSFSNEPSAADGWGEAEWDVPIPKPTAPKNASDGWGNVDFLQDQAKPAAKVVVKEAPAKALNLNAMKKNEPPGWEDW
jgi:hypothetical protein